MKTTIPPPILGIVIGGGMWTIDHCTPEFEIHFIGQNYLAVLFAVIGLTIDVIAVFAFFKAKTTINPLQPANTKSLVISGLYRFSRNPMYLGMLLILSGLTIWLGNPVNLLMIGLFVVLINTLQIIPEEKVLHNKFGHQFSDYSKRVRRWI